MDGCVREIERAPARKAANVISVFVNKELKKSFKKRSIFLSFVKAKRMVWGGHWWNQSSLECSQVSRDELTVIVKEPLGFTIQTRTYKNI